VTSPSAGRGSRGAQYFFCNGRFIKSQLLQAALEQAYRNTLLTGRYPGCVLYLDLSLGSVDVNVHPAKTEVKFSYERRVFDLVYHAALSALQGEDRLTEQPAASAPKPAPAPAPRSEAPQKPDFFRSMSAEAFRAARRDPEPRESGSAMRLHAPEYQEQTRLDLTPPPPSAPSAPKSLETTGFAPSSGPKAVENSVQNVESAPIPDHKILGEALKTYILVEVGEQLLLIDKHAAHERMNFDRLKAMDRQILSQTLLAPVTLRPDPGDCELLEQNGELLSELGFEIEPFGPGAYLLRAVPADILPGDGAPALEEILEKLRRGKAPDPAAARDELLHTVACKAAIKAGWDTGRQELERIVEEVLSGRVKYCPHGRPVSAVLSKKDLEKMFKRIV
jgi:DNA mismatch repair protein MutL